MSAPVRLIALDFDGTCARYEPELVVDDPVREILRPHLGNGIRWAFNSDRDPHRLLEVAMRLPPAERPDAILARQRDILLRDGEGYRAHEPHNTERQERHRALWARLTPAFADWEAEIRAAFEVLESYVNDHAFAFRVPHPQAEALHQHLRGLVVPWTDAQVSGNQEWSFVLHASFSKAALLEEAARVFAVPPESVLAIGDGLNDLTMLDGRITPRVGCPANACAPVKEAVARAGGLVADLHEAHGAAAILRHFLTTP